MRKEKNDDHEFEDYIECFGLSMDVEPSEVEIIDLEEAKDLGEEDQLGVVEVVILGDGAQEEDDDSQKVDEEKRSDVVSEDAWAICDNHSSVQVPAVKIDENISYQYQDGQKVND